MSENNKPKVAEYTATINGWRFSAIAYGSQIEITPYMPEQLKLTFKTTGRRGGDGGHGGAAQLIFSSNGGGCHEAPDIEDNKYGGIESTTITAEGDWELEGLAASLLLLGRVMEAQKVCEITSFSMVDENDKGRIEAEKAIIKSFKQSGGAE